MAINNRSLDATEQRKVVSSNFAALATGVTRVIGMVPWASTLEKGQIAVYGVSGSPTYTVAVSRFIVGAGLTTFAVSAAQAPRDFGTSGLLAAGVSLVGTSALLNLMANDVLMMSTGGANSAATDVSVQLVLKPIQDSKTHFGLI